jgi:hypothetical protein
MIETIELMITLILLSLLYILLFGEPGYIIPTIELEHKVIESELVDQESESEVEYDDNESNSDGEEEDPNGE